MNLEGLTEKRRGQQSLWYENANGEVVAKRCSKCSDIKPLDNYGLQSNGLGGRTSTCRACHSERCREYRENKRPEDAPRRPSYTIEDVRKVFADAGCVLLSEEYHDANTPLDYVCNCSNVSKVCFINFRLGNRCKKCGAKKRALKKRHTHEYVKQVFEDAGCTLLSESYVGAKDNLEFICRCGNTSTINLSNFQIRKRCYRCGFEKLRGENSPKYNPNLTEEERIAGRKYPEYIEWRNYVFERDDYTCQCCTKVGGELSAHHLDGFNWATDRRTAVNNGITLCKECHKQFHDEYGRGNNTKEQFLKWVEANRQRFNLEQERYERLIEWLGKAVDKTVKKYRALANDNTNEKYDDMAK